MRLTKTKIVISFLFLFNCAFAANENDHTITFDNEIFHFSWNLNTDGAVVIKNSTEKIWNGSLLPAFVIEDKNGIQKYIKASVADQSIEQREKKVILELRFKEFGTGRLTISKEEWGISIDKFTIKWFNEIPRIISLYFGTSQVLNEGKSFLNSDELPFRSDWSAAGFCVPGAKEGTVQSYFRMWDFGQTTIALGSYGPSLGTLYGAAFPRPTLSFAMGNDNGWVAFGSGTIPEGAMLLQLQNTKACIKYLFREDLWGEGNQEREWEKPIQITFGNNSWEAIHQYFKSLPSKEPISQNHSKSIWNTWGNWRNKEYPIQPMVDFARKLEAEQFIVDDPWEESQGLGKPSLDRFPNFYKDFQYIDNNQMQRGIWETLGWITDTAKAGLSSADLIVNKNGVPCKASWSFDAFGGGFYCIDISSERSRKFLQERTVWTMKKIKPKIIKLDFGYGLPSPNMGVPRDPSLRGEKYSYELFKLIVKAAKSVDPEVTIMYYGINPLYLEYVDMISLDDQGDLWYDIKGGHDQWSIWASLLADYPVVISGSSSYDWHTDDEVILNSIVLGTPGAVLATHLDDGSPVPEKYLNRRLAVNSWYRKNVQWEPVWLNSSIGDLSSPPDLKCWGRNDLINHEKVLTAVVLRGKDGNDLAELDPLDWNGRWAVISQTNESIFKSTKIAIVPFDAGNISMQLSRKPLSIEKKNIHGTVSYSDWEWKNGAIQLIVNQQELKETAGYIINLPQTKL